MILKNENTEYYINDDILHKPKPPVVYVKEIPSLDSNIVDGKVTGTIYYINVPHFLEEFKNHDGNIASVRAFPPFPKSNEHLNFILTYIRSQLKDENTKVFFDNVHEGNVIGSIIGIHKIIKILNLNSNNVFFFSHGFQAHELYESYCIENNITDKINIRVISAWERHVVRTTNTSIEPKYEVSVREKTFLCFNRIARRHRIALLGLLYSKNLIQKSFYSFFTTLYGDTPIELAMINLKNYITEDLYNLVLENFNNHKHEFPLKLNSISGDDNVNYVKDDDYKYYDNSYFSVVTETFFFRHPQTNILADAIYDEISIFFSEKIFKPIICKHPFILLCRPHSLEYLKKLGYKTFSPYIDESYDLIENDEERLIAIVNEIQRLSEQTNEEWIEWQKNVLPIIEHNYQVIINKKITDFEFKP